MNLNPYFQDLEKKLTNLTPVLPEISEIIASSIEENFLSLGRYNGGTDILDGGTGRWKKLSPNTIRRYRYLGKNLDPTLQRSAGGLASSIQVRPTDQRTIEVSANKVYAAIHQYGGTVSPKIPITPKMRKYFWAQYFETRDEKYKAMALTRKSVMTPRITIPARPFLVLQQEDFLDIQEVIQNYLFNKM